MRTLLRLAAAVALLAVPAHAAAQEAVRIEPKEAMQCAVWASILSEAGETQAGLLYALSYFVGQYEGATGQSINNGHDEAAVIEVGSNPDAFTPTCQGHMMSFGPRMIEWGKVLNELGERVATEQGK